MSDLQWMLDEAAAEMPWPTRAVDTSEPIWDYKVSFCFISEDIGIPHPLWPDAKPVCRTEGVGSRHPSSVPLYGIIQRAAEEHRELLAQEIERGHTYVDH